MAGIAVLVIDVQHAYFSGPNAAYRGDAVIDGINRLTAAARAANAPVFIVQHDEPGDEEVLFGSEGWALPASLLRADSDRMVRKHFGDSFHGTALEQQLDELGIDRLVVCGFATEYCVNTGARSAAMLGYQTTVVSDLHTTQQGPDLTPVQIIQLHNRVWGSTSLQGNPLSVRPLADVLATEFA